MTISKELSSDIMQQAQAFPAVTVEDIREGIRLLGASNRPVCVHSSLRSFGWVEGGAQAVIDGVLAEGCTLLVPTFSWVYQVRPPLGRRPAQNSSDYDSLDWGESGIGLRYTPDSTEVDADMGIIPATVLRLPEHVRGNHPMCSFTAAGPLARDLIYGQAPLDVNAPLRTLAETDGLVILMGVGLERMTLIHAAEQLAGRNLFRRWASDPDGGTVEVETGGCSEGFGNLMSALAPVTKEMRVGKSTWLTFYAQSALAAAFRAILENPSVTRCSRSNWHRCDDAILGGPIL